MRVTRSHSDIARERPERKTIEPALDGQLIGPPIVLPPMARVDAVRRVTLVTERAGNTLTEKAEILQALGLLPAGFQGTGAQLLAVLAGEESAPDLVIEGPRSVVCPICGAVVGAACTQNGGRDTYEKFHVKRQDAARKAAL